jgi:DNA polymerase-3 subunit beta
MTNIVKLRAASLAEEVAWMAKAKASYGTPHAEVAAIVGGLRMRRTDYALWRESNIGAEGGGQARVLVDPARLAALLKGVTGDAVIEVGEEHLGVRCGGRNVKLKAAGRVEDFPAWPVFEPLGQEAIVGSGQLSRALTSVGVDDTLPMLTGVRFDNGTMASTDRFRLSAITYDRKGFTALLPGDALRPFASGAEVITIEHGRKASDKPSPDEGLARVSSGGRSIVAALLDCEFPRWRQLIPADDTLTVQVMVKRDDLLDAIDGDQVRLTLRADTITVLSSSLAGDVEIEQDIACEPLAAGGFPFTVAINAKNLVGCVKGIPGNLVRIMASKPALPVLLRGVTDDELQLLMPIRLPEGGK